MLWTEWGGFRGRIEPHAAHPQVKEDEEKVFFGIRADNRIFGLYRTLLLETEGPAPRAEPIGPTPIPATTR